MGNTAQTLFFAGHARLPQGMAAQNVFESLSITVEVDARYAVVIEASCTLATEHGRVFIRDLLRGYSLLDGVAEPITEIQRRYIGRAASALVAALKDLEIQFERCRASSARA
ncbi:DUF3870 domain-containing protein [Crenobacter cavernae]|uniref:DUF3870 domain-containing protein n=1 Tax=Crenobacter cavernae TaxID=2290923 RepID=A0ABY0FEY9_9NEIS|nr:DUF3870 domain-containing protein [Crenobacter cavernae]RXZ42795.1 DUF3870 domain-containing protein [Crenobacter cavernae]